MACQNLFSVGGARRHSGEIRELILEISASDIGAKCMFQSEGPARGL